MTVVIGGTREEIPGIASVCWLDGNPKVKYVTDKKKRERVCRGIVCHTHEGVLGELLEGLGPNTTMDERLAMYQTQTDRIVSWDWTQDQNGDVTWQNDPLVDYTFHGNQVCDVTVGFELIQKVRRNSKGEVVGGDLYSGQIAAAVLMIDFITARLGIQRQIPWDKKRNRPVRGVVGRIAAGGGDVVGIYGHRNITTNRGAGDPGDAIFGTEPVITTEGLKRDMDFLTEAGVKRAILFRLGGLDSEFASILCGNKKIALPGSEEKQGICADWD
jgi:hypothetical protein